MSHRTSPAADDEYPQTLLWGGLPTAPPDRPQVSSDTTEIMATERYRITDDAHVYFVTYSIVEWLPVFISEEACRIIPDFPLYQSTRLPVPA